MNHRRTLGQLLKTASTKLLHDPKQRTSPSSLSSAVVQLVSANNADKAAVQEAPSTQSASYVLRIS